MNLTHFKSEFASMRRTLFRSSILGLGLIVGLGACKDDDNAGGVVANGKSFIRYVNSVWQQGFADGDTTYAPIKIDVLIDSSGNAPGVIGLAANSVSDGGSGPNGYSEAGFFEFEPGVHSFVARRGDIPNGPSFFITSTSTTSCSPAQYLPRQQMTGTTFYTLNLAGVNPRVTMNAGNPVNNLAVKTQASGTTRCDFVFTPGSLSSVEDPFSPPWNTYGGTNHYQARFFFWHSAPFAGTNRPLSTGFGEPTKSVRIWVTPGGGTAPLIQDLIRVTPWESGLGFGAKGTAQNVAAGTYWVTIVFVTSGRDALQDEILVQKEITFAAGDVKTFFLMNTLPSGETALRVTTPTADPNTRPKNVAKWSDIHKLEERLMNKFSF